MSRPTVSHYETLGVPSSVTKEDLRKRFYELSRTHHPDVPLKEGQDKETRDAKFKELSHAYSVLSDEKLRTEYDRKNKSDRVSYTQPRSRPSARQDIWRHRSQQEEKIRQQRAQDAWGHARHTQANQKQTGGSQTHTTGTYHSDFNATQSRVTHSAFYNRYHNIQQSKLHRAKQSPNLWQANQIIHERATSRLRNDKGLKRIGQLVFVLGTVSFLGVQIIASRQK